MDDSSAPQEFVLDLPRAIDRELASDIEKQSVYVSEELVSLRVSGDLRQVAVRHRCAGDTAALRDKATRYLAAMLQRFRRIEPTVHFRRPASGARALATGVFQELLQRQWAFQHSEGVVSLSGPALALLEALDASFAREYAARFSAVPRQYPALVKAALLARCGYFEMHPNALSFVSHLRNDFDEIEAFRQANAGATGLRTTHPGAFAPVHHCLNPAACFPCYEDLEHRSVPEGGLVLTWRGRVFRYEAGNTVGLDRLREFNVRELVFVGADAFVRQGRAGAVELSRSLLDAWDLAGRVETATDPFFATVYAARTFWQEATEVKYEVCLDVEPAAAGTPRSIAAGSLNLHGAFFGDRFDIRDHAGAPAHSGCVGWGLERWVLAVFSQHGFEVQKWPRALRTQVS